MTDEKKYIDVEPLYAEYDKSIQWLKDNVSRLSCGQFSEQMASMQSAKKMLLDAPAADVRPVVRDTPYMEEALQAVIAERKRQIELYGNQNGTPLNDWPGILGEEFGELCEAINESTFENKRHPERGGVENIYKEASHVAATAIQIMEAILAGFRPNSETTK